MGFDFTPIDVEQMHDDDAMTEQVAWYALIRDMETFRERTGWGLANTWGNVNNGDYEEAWYSFATLLAEWPKYWPAHQAPDHGIGDRYRLDRGPKLRDSRK